MSCSQTILDVQAGAIPAGFKGDLQETFNLWASLLIVTFPEDVSTFVIGNSEPPTNSGPWLNTSVEPSEWYVWSDVQGKYVPLGIPQETLGYQISQTQPDPTKFDLWFEIDSNGELCNIYTHDGANWVTKLINEDDLNTAVPKGIITMWSGGAGAIPAKWRLCAAPDAGSTVNGVVIPDLSDRFIVGAGASKAINDTGGNDITGTTVIAGTTDPHALTISEMPAHDHNLQIPTNPVGDGNPRMDQTFSTAPPYTALVQPTSSTGGGQGHSHNINFSSSTESGLPAYYALAFIIFVDQV